MVGRLTLGSNPFPIPERRRTALDPPPYKVHSIAHHPSSPAVSGENTPTRTEIITTTQSTSLFTLPLWGKRNRLPSPVTQRSNPRVNAYEPVSPSPRTTASSSSLRIIDNHKELPPTPRENHVKGQTQRSVTEPELLTTGKALFTNTTQEHENSGNVPSSKGSSQTSASALAHAALGLGLPHVMPRVSASSASDINTVSFIPAKASTSNKFPSPSIRRAKSSHGLETASPPISDLDQASSIISRRRKRMLSSGTLSFPNLSLVDVKGKGRDYDGYDSPPQHPKVITKKSSFWSRKKTLSSPYAAPSPDTSETYQLSLHTLPPLHTTSPFQVDLPMDTPRPSSPPALNHTRGLSRSHSERTRTYHSISPISKESSSNPVPPSKHRIQKRPATSDNATRSHNFRSMYVEESRELGYLPPPKVEGVPRPRTAPKASSLTQRPRAQTNPPLLHRLSLNIFSSADNFSSSHSNSTDISSTKRNFSSVNVHLPPIVPKPLYGQESPNLYLTRLRAVIGKAEIAGILASSSDPFYVEALRIYIKEFDFVDDPLDIALRKLLMEVGLPRETQQIDRVMEAFAARYSQCNPDLFVSEDHPYILAFSLIMLHTDAFNKSNRRKMSKADYIKNTRLPGIVPEVLECFYDNIVFAPFIFIEDPLDANGQRCLTSEDGNQRISTTTQASISNNPGSATLIPRIAKVDPYYLISNNLLGPLRVNINTYISFESPYSYEGSAGHWDDEELHRAFASANVIEVGTYGQSRPSLNGSHTSPPVPTRGFSDSFSKEISVLKVIKVGLLGRKDDTVEGGRKSSNRKWRPWGVILTGSQLLFFRDTSWVMSLLAQSTSDEQIMFSHPMFKPDEILSLEGAIAIYDKSYTKHPNTLRFVMPSGRQLLLQASDAKELNEWISRINYAGAFKSAGIRIRPLGMSGRDVHLTGVAAATSHLHDLQIRRQASASKSGVWNSDAAHELMDMLTGNALPESPSANKRITVLISREDMDLDVPVAPEVEGADQFKETFDQVKAELAASNVNGLDEDINTPPHIWFDGLSSTSPLSIQSDNSRLPTRSQIIHAKIDDLEIEIAKTRTQLDADMRYVRNIATLTPFRKVTRDRISQALQVAVKRVMQVRLRMTKLTCYRDILAADLLLEGQSWVRVKKLALRAAKETLQSRQSGNTPQMTVSMHGDNRNLPLPMPEVTTESSDSWIQHHQPESSDSFHSATEFGSDSIFDDASSPTILENSQVLETSRPTTSGSQKSSHFSLAESYSTGRPSPMTAQEILEEQAEAWNKTRCAQRVSLIRVPSDIHLTRFGWRGEMGTSESAGRAP